MSFLYKLLILMVSTVISSTVSGQEEVPVGSNVTMNCSDFFDSDPAYTINWFAVVSGIRTRIMSQNQGSSYEETPPGTGYATRLSRPKWGVCQLRNIKIGDASLYECVQIIPGNTKKLNFSYIIAATPPQPNTSVSRSSVEVNATVVFTCTPHPDTRGTLIFNFNKVGGGPSGVTDPTAGTLTISRAKVNDTGNYTCQVTNIAGTSQSSSPAELLVTTPTTAAPTSNSSGHSLSGGEIAGIVIGFLAGGGLIVVLIVFAVKSQSLSGGEFAGIVIGCLVGLAVFIGLTVFPIIRRSLSGGQIAGLVIGCVAGCVLIVCLIVIAAVKRQPHYEGNQT